MTVCGATTRGGKSCTRPAGWGTSHPTEGRCKLHGGASNGRPVEHGRYSVAHRASLADKYEQFLSDPNPGDLTDELALLRTLLQNYLDRFKEGVTFEPGHIDRIYGMIEGIGRLVERIARILNQTALTQAEVQYLQARLSDLIVKYIDDDSRREQFISELQAAFSVRRRALREPIDANYSE